MGSSVKGLIASGPEGKHKIYKMISAELRPELCRYLEYEKIRKELEELKGEPVKGIGFIPVSISLEGRQELKVGEPDFDDEDLSEEIEEIEEEENKPVPVKKNKTFRKSGRSFTFRKSGSK